MFLGDRTTRAAAVDRVSPAVNPRKITPENICDGLMAAQFFYDNFGWRFRHAAYLR